jgi:hypothetical protein
MLKIPYKNVIEVDDGCYPLLYAEMLHPDEDLRDTIGISKKFIQFYSPLTDGAAGKRYMVTLIRDDSVREHDAYGKQRYRVEKNADTNEVSIWPSVLLKVSDPNKRQEFRIRDNVALVNPSRSWQS